MQKAIFKYLLSKGANPNAVIKPDYGGVKNYSAMHRWVGVRCGAWCICCLLVLPLPSLHTCTPSRSQLLAGCRVAYDGQQDMTQQLVAAGGNLNPRDSRGYTVRSPVGWGHD
jgi:hypothetical protein